MEKNTLASCPYNLDPTVLGGFALPPKVDVNEVTLREGEEAADVSFTLEEKVAVAERLDEIGVAEIEVGWPNRSEIDREAVRRMKAKGLKARIQALAMIGGPDWKKEIDASIECGADIVSLLHASSDIRLQYAGLTRKDVLARAKEAMRYAVGRGPMISYSPTDTTRTDLEFLRQLMLETAEAGSERMSLSDTLGLANPEAIRHMVSRVKSWVPLPIQIHCHNDFGLALANTIAGVQGGATIVDATINGLGERNGNAALDEVAVALKVLYGVDTGLKLDRLFGLSRYIQEITAVPIPFNKPLVGDHSFAHKLDVHVKGVLTYPPLSEAIPPETVGNHRVIPIGRGTGPFVVEHKLKEHGLEATPNQVEQILTKVKLAAAHKRASLTDQEFLNIAHESL